MRMSFDAADLRRGVFLVAGMLLMPGVALGQWRAEDVWNSLEETGEVPPTVPPPPIEFRVPVSQDAAGSWRDARGPIGRGRSVPDVRGLRGTAGEG